MPGLVFIKGAIPFELHDLTRSDLNALTRILSIPLSPPLTEPRTSTGAECSTVASKKATRTRLEQRSKNVTQMIKFLPRRLKAPIPFQGAVVSLLSELAPIPPAAPLCSVHSPLNSQLIHTIFTAIVAEVTVNLSLFQDRFPALDARLQDVMHDLRALQALWLPRDRYRANALDRWTLQPDGCQACILARMGADEPTLGRLRVALLSRWPEHRAKPRLLRWVEACMGWTGRREEIEQASDLLALMLKEVRKEVKAARKAGRAGDMALKSPVSGGVLLAVHPSRKQRCSGLREGLRGASQKGEGGWQDKAADGDGIGNKEAEHRDDEDEDEQNFEDKIIDYYAALSSASKLVSSAEPFPGMSRTQIPPLPSIPSAQRRHVPAPSRVSTHHSGRGSGSSPPSSNETLGTSSVDMRGSERGWRASTVLPYSSATSVSMARSTSASSSSSSSSSQLHHVEEKGAPHRADAKSSSALRDIHPLHRPPSPSIYGFSHHHMASEALLLVPVKYHQHASTRGRTRGGSERRGGVEASVDETDAHRRSRRRERGKIEGDRDSSDMARSYQAVLPSRSSVSAGTLASRPALPTSSSAARSTPRSLVLDARSAAHPSSTSQTPARASPASRSTPRPSSSSSRSNARAGEAQSTVTVHALSPYGSSRVNHSKASQLTTWSRFLT
ncbi:MAG: hypothetical protein M1838_001684 [Thelocarpon superellum]|nr:MAG: hypothetical protein M1838_001684 [Thelocarpon superellum]